MLRWVWFGVMAVALLLVRPLAAEHGGLAGGFGERRVAMAEPRAAGAAVAPDPAPAPAPAPAPVPRGTVIAAPRLEGGARTEPLDPALPTRRPPVRYYSLRAGGDLSPTDQGLSVAVGFPRIDVNYYFHLRPDLELAPEVSLLYGLGATVPVVGTFVGTEVRYRFWRKGQWAASLLAEPAVALFFHPETAFGLRIGAPGVQVAWNGIQGGYAYAGAKLSPLVVFASKVLVSLPIVATLGGELHVHEAFNVFAEIELGPDVRKVEGNDSSTFLHVSTVVGFTWKD